MNHGAASNQATLIRPARVGRPGRLVKAVVHRISETAEELWRILSMSCLLAPAAYFLPKRWALTLADTLALSLLILPTPGRDTYLEMRFAFRKSRRTSLLLAWHKLAQSFRDFVVLRRVLYKREDLASWRIIEVNSRHVAPLRESGESYLLASAHFLREAVLALYAPAVTGAHVVQVVRPPPQPVRSLSVLRTHIQYKTLVAAFRDAWGKRTEHVNVGIDLRAGKTLYDHLRRKGNVVSIHIDAPWERSLPRAYERPFLAFKCRTFATGIVQLARLTQRPIVSCVYSKDENGSIVLEWGPPISVISSSPENENRVMDELIDVIERAVAERPAQYPFPIGFGRYWNSENKKWEAY